MNHYIDLFITTLIFCSCNLSLITFILIMQCSVSMMLLSHIVIFAELCWKYLLCSFLPYCPLLILVLMHNINHSMGLDTKSPLRSFIKILSIGDSILLGVNINWNWQKSYLFYWLSYHSCPHTLQMCWYFIFLEISY